MRKLIPAVALALLLAGCAAPQPKASHSESMATSHSTSTKAKASTSASLPFADSTPLTHVAYISDLYNQDVGFELDKAGYYLRLRPNGRFWLRVAGTFATPAFSGNALDQSRVGLKTDILYTGRYDQVAPGKMKLTLDGQIAYLFKHYSETKVTVESAFATPGTVKLVRQYTARQVVTWPLASAKERLGFPLMLTRQNGQVALHMLDGNDMTAFPLAKSDGLVQVLAPLQFVKQYQDD